MSDLRNYGNVGENRALALRGGYESEGRRGGYEVGTNYVRPIIDNDLRFRGVYSSSRPTGLKYDEPSDFMISSRAQIFKAPVLGRDFR